MAKCLHDVEKLQKFIFFQCCSSLGLFKAESYFMPVSFNEGIFFRAGLASKLNNTEQFSFEMRQLTKV